MPTIEDVVKKSGVSRSTVFRFLNGKKVRDNSKKSIIEAMKELDYKVEEITKNENINFEISVSSEYIHFQGFTQMIQGIMESCEKEKIKVSLVTRSGEQIDEDYKSWSTNNKKGILIIGKNKKDELKEAKYLVKNNIPHIFVNHPIDYKNASYISTDFERAAYELTNYLINKGHKKILTLGNPDELLVDELKIKGYLKALKDNNIETIDNYIIKEKDAHSIDYKLKNILKSSERPSAFFGICDSKALRFINIASSLGISVPKDISVVGMDNIDISQYSVPKLTTIEVNFKELGKKSVEQLILLMTDGYTCINGFVGHNIIERSSVIEF